ncbi:MAG: protein kinase [Polyangiaceae bacterium]
MPVDSGAPTEVDVKQPARSRVERPGGERRTMGWSIDHFTLGRELGWGGMGTVYLAKDTSLDRTVALKILREDMAAKIDARERFVREARAQARVNSPYVVQIYFIGYVPARSPDDDADPTERPRSPTAVGALYFAMEFIDGESLEGPLERDEKLDPERARTILIDVARGLADASRAGIIHRDIKPGNLLVSKAGHVKVADFGLAKPSDPKQGLTRGGVIMGTPHYMAPEQGLAQPLDLRADMYALGCTFYHLVAGDAPFKGSNAVQLIAQHMNAEPPSLAARAPHVPLPLVRIIERLMKKKREERYASYAELIAALEAAAPRPVEYAGFWARGAALLIDVVLGSVLIGLFRMIGLGVFLLYMSLGHGLLQKTVGKYLLRLEVVRPDGTRLGAPRAFLRTAVKFWFPILMAIWILSTESAAELRDAVTSLSGFEGAKRLVIPLVISNLALSIVYAAGFLVAVVRRDKRALHDLAAGSVVRYRLGRVRK